MGLLSFLSGGKGNPAKAAMPYLDKIPAVGEQYYNPYIQQGQESGGMVSQQYQQLLQDPTAFLNKLQQGYEPTQQYQTQSKYALDAARNSAAAAGNLGSQLDQRRRAELVQGLMGQDMQRYLQNVLGLYGQGLQGQQHLADQGFDASSQLADYLGQAYGAQGSLAYQGDAFKRQQKANFLNALLGAGAQGAGAYYGLKNLK